MAKAISYRDIVIGLRELGLDAADTVIAHADLAAFGELRGGAETLVGALVASGSTVVMPAFTYQTMIVPSQGPPDNGMEYGNQAEQNASAEMFHPALPVHASLGLVAEAFRCLPQARRSSHPVLSFAAIGERAEEILATQSIQDPWAPVNWVQDNAGDVLLLGADHTANVAIHLAERLADRKQFVRWAVSDERAFRLESFPGCSRGFNAIAPKLAWVAQQTTIGPAILQRIPLRKMVDIAAQMIRADRAALLCDDSDCALCNAVRAVQ